MRRGSTQPLSPDDSQYVTGSEDGFIQLWHARSGTLIRSFQPDKNEKAIRLLGISPDGNTLAAACQATFPPWYQEMNWPSVVYLWDLRTGKRLGPPLEHASTIRCLVFSPDGKSLFSGTDQGSGKIWDVRSGKPLSQPVQHQNTVSAARFSPDGRTIVTGGRDGGVRFWDVATGRQLAGTLSSRKMPVSDLAFTADGNRLVIVRGEETVGQIDLLQLARGVSHATRKTREPLHKADWVANTTLSWFGRNLVDCSPDTTRVIAARHNYAGLYDSASGQPVHLDSGGPFRSSYPAVGVTAFSPDGRCFATSSRDVTPASDARLWDATTGRLIGSPLPHTNYVAALAFSPDGKILATGDYDRGVHFWDTITGRRIGSSLPQAEIVIALAFSPDGKTLAVGLASDSSKRASVILWDVKSRTQLGQLIPTFAGLFRFSGDGKRLLITGGRTLRLWDASSGLPIGEANTESGEINTLAIRRDDKMLLVGSVDGTLRLRDAATGKPIGTPMHYPYRVNSAAFSPDAEGRLIVAGYSDGSAQLWDRVSQKPVGTAVLQGKPVLAVRFSPDGRSFLSIGEDGTARRWPVPAPAEGSLERLTLQLEVHSALAMIEGQILVPLRPAQWRRRRKQLAELDQSAHIAPPIPMSDRDYHEARARDAEQEGNTFAARWHLDHLIAAGLPADNAWQAYARRARCYALQGNYALAELDYASALACASSELLVNWYRYCIVECIRHQQWETVLWYSQRVIPAAPDDWQVYADRAIAHEKLGHGQERDADLDRVIALGSDTNSLVLIADELAGRASWDKAVSALIAASKHGPIPISHYEPYALACLKTGDRTRYRSLCSRLIERARQTQSPEIANFVAWTCALGPAALDDYAGAIALCELALKKAPSKERRAAALNTLGVLYYRAGRYREAITHLHESLQKDEGHDLAYDWLFLAMSHHCLGEPAQAREYLGKAARYKPAKKRTAWDTLEIEMLREEAETQIKSNAACHFSRRNCFRGVILLASPPRARDDDAGSAGAVCRPMIRPSRTRRPCNGGNRVLLLPRM